MVAETFASLERGPFRAIEVNNLNDISHIHLLHGNVHMSGSINSRREVKEKILAVDYFWDEEEETKRNEEIIKDYS